MALGASVADKAQEGVPRQTLGATPTFNPFRDWDGLYQQLGRLLTANTDVAAFGSLVEQFVENIRRFTKRDTDSAIFVMVRLHEPRYPIGHSLQTAFLCALLAERLDWEQSAKTSLVAAALTMKIALIELQAQLTEQSKPPTEAQRTEIQSHTIRGRQQLEAMGVRDVNWLRWVEDHPESSDGKRLPSRDP